MRRDECEAFMRAALAKDQAKPESLWKTAYRTLLWYEPIGTGHLPHIFDSNALKKPDSSWMNRAKTAHSYLCQEFGVKDFRPLSDRLMGQFPAGTQRQNPLGIGLSSLMREAFVALAGVRSEPEVPVSELAPGATNKAFYTGSKKVDLLIKGRSEPIVGVSNKWSLRNDRDVEVASQAQFLKAHSQVRYFAIVTNEFGIGRLKQLLEFDSINAIYHLNRDLLAKVHAPDAIPNGRLKDVSTLFAEVKRWVA